MYSEAFTLLFFTHTTILTTIRGVTKWKVAKIQFIHRWIFSHCGRWGSDASPFLCEYGPKYKITCRSPFHSLDHLKNILDPALARPVAGWHGALSNNTSPWVAKGRGDGWGGSRKHETDQYRQTRRPRPQINARTSKSRWKRMDDGLIFSWLLIKRIERRWTWRAGTMMYTSTSLKSFESDYREK